MRVVGWYRVHVAVSVPLRKQGDEDRGVDDKDDDGAILPTEENWVDDQRTPRDKVLCAQ